MFLASHPHGHHPASSPCAWQIPVSHTSSSKSSCTLSYSHPLFPSSLSPKIHCAIERPERLRLLCFSVLLLEHPLAFSAIKATFEYLSGKPLDNSCGEIGTFLCMLLRPIILLLEPNAFGLVWYLGVCTSESHTKPEALQGLKQWHYYYFLTCMLAITAHYHLNGLNCHQSLLWKNYYPVSGQWCFYHLHAMVKKKKDKDFLQEHQFCINGSSRVLFASPATYSSIHSTFFRGCDFSLPLSQSRTQRETRHFWINK